MSNCKHDLRGDSCPYCENEKLRDGLKSCQKDFDELAKRLEVRMQDNEALRTQLKEEKELVQGLEGNLKACESHCDEELAAAQQENEALRKQLTKDKPLGHTE